MRTGLVALLLLLLPLPASATLLTVESGAIDTRPIWDQEPDGQIGGRGWSAIGSSASLPWGETGGSWRIYTVTVGSATYSFFDTPPAGDNPYQINSRIAFTLGDFSPIFPNGCNTGVDCTPTSAPFTMTGVIDLGPGF
jgi:hypothetical protein